MSSLLFTILGCHLPVHDYLISFGTKSAASHPYPPSPPSPSNTTTCIPYYSPHKCFDYHLLWVCPETWVTMASCIPKTSFLAHSSPPNSTIIIIMHRSSCQVFHSMYANFLSFYHYLSFTYAKAPPIDRGERIECNCNNRNKSEVRCKL